MTIKKFECIIDDGEHVWKEYIPATSKKELMNTWGGNGEFVKIKEFPNICHQHYQSEKLLKKTATEKQNATLFIEYFINT